MTFQETVEIKRTKEKPWMTSETLYLMGERRKSKANKGEFKRLNKAVQRKSKEAIDDFLAAQCEEIEVQKTKFGSFHMDIKIKKWLDVTGSRQLVVLSKIQMGV